MTYIIMSFIIICCIILSAIIIYLAIQHNQQCDKIISLQQQLEHKQELDESAVQELNATILHLNIQKDYLTDQHESILKEIAEIKSQKDQMQSDEILMRSSADVYIDTLDKAQTAKEKAFDQKIKELDAQMNVAQQELDKIRATLSAGVEAQLREEEKKKKLDFYKITLTANELNDIELLSNLRGSFKNVTVLNKLIWSEFLQKKVSELVARVVGKTDKTGIYKITNLKTQQCYIGQSVSIGERFKQHCKCGCGIGASVSNKLYISMQEDGIWNFSFEVLEECPRNQLNEKEKLWIDLYQSNVYGLNSTKGGS